MSGTAPGPGHTHHEDRSHTSAGGGGGGRRERGEGCTVNIVPSDRSTTTLVMMVNGGMKIGD